MEFLHSRKFNYQFILCHHFIFKPDFHFSTFRCQNNIIVFLSWSQIIHLFIYIYGFKNWVTPVQTLKISKFLTCFLIFFFCWKFKLLSQCELFIVKYNPFFQRLWGKKSIVFDTKTGESWSEIVNFGSFLQVPLGNTDLNPVFLSNLRQMVEKSPALQQFVVWVSRRTKHWRNSSIFYLWVATFHRREKETGPKQNGRRLTRGSEVTVNLDWKLMFKETLQETV